MESNGKTLELPPRPDYYCGLDAPELERYEVVDVDEYKYMNDEDYGEISDCMEAHGVSRHEATGYVRYGIRHWDESSASTSDSVSTSSSVAFAREVMIDDQALDDFETFWREQPEAYERERQIDEYIERTGYFL